MIIKQNKRQTFCFAVDDNIRFLKELTEKKPESIFIPITSGISLNSRKYEYRLFPF